MWSWSVEVDLSGKSCWCAVCPFPIKEMGSKDLLMANSIGQGAQLDHLERS